MGIDSVFRAKPLSISCFEEGGWKFLEPWEEARKTTQDHWLKVANEPYLSSFR